ncbi:trehalose-phosphatase [Nigerium massiliense]|uniref:trehalose-phosphatase n=1 Tax=Nigerium massiliense TaxID=1522317 RepID=UPI001F1961D2|nr:trehalose-phosphatase [Nigerium massiliense]
MTITTQTGRRAWDAIVADPASTLLCSDFDGVLSPIQADPDTASAAPETVAALNRLGTKLGKIAVVTGRVARKAVELGSFEKHDGLAEMSVLGLYGQERWDAATGEYREPEPPEGIAGVKAELPAVLAELGLANARVEDKRLSVGVHTRELPDAAGAFATLEQPIRSLAERHGLLVEPGRNVLEIRGPGSDKGDAVRALVAEVQPRTIIFAGDDLGDVAAFEAIARLREEGYEGLLICSGSDEQDALVALADVVVPGPPGVAALLNDLADALGA